MATKPEPRYSVACDKCRWSGERPTPAACYEERCPQCGAFGSLVNFGRLVETAAEVDDALIAEIADCVEGFTSPGEPIDWQDIFERVESGGSKWGDDCGVSFGDQWETPAQRKIKRKVREALREG